MCVSSKVCAQHLDILFGLLQSKIEFGVKANIIISLADLFTKFPNLMNERVKDIFMLLHDKECLVRQQALMVITHLILNDMLKIRGEIVDICMLLEDTDERIRDQVKLFLHELHSKGSHLIYNMFLKAVSRLSKEFEHLQKTEFENIARNLMHYIKQDKQTETLIEKLCLKLKNSTLPTEWRNTAFCIS
jgi:condensin complex subunit 1